MVSSPKRGNFETLSTPVRHVIKLWGYCWWTKSCTTKDDDYPIIYRVLTIPGGAGFCPSTVCQKNNQLLRHEASSMSKTPRDSGLSRSPEGALAHRVLHLKRPVLQSFGQPQIVLPLWTLHKWWLILICLGCTDAPSFLLANMRKNHWVGSFQVVQEIEHYLGVFFTYKILE